jgi:hypothetical protein
VSERSTSTTSDLKGGLAWMALGGLVVVESLRMERFTQMGASLYTMPGFTPGMIGVVLIVLGALLAWRGWRARTPDRAGAAVPARDPGDAMLNQRMLATLVLTLVYAGVLIGRVPFSLATAVFVAAFTWHFGAPETAPARRATSAVLAGLFTALIVVLVFERIFLVRLP